MHTVDDYIRLADLWGAAMECGEGDIANDLHDRVQNIYQELEGKGQHHSLFDRAMNSNDAACFFIASHLKDQQRARLLYNRLKNSHYPFLAMSAQAILREMDNRSDG